MRQHRERKANRIEGVETMVGDHDRGRDDREERKARERAWPAMEERRGLPDHEYLRRSGKLRRAQPFVNTVPHLSISSRARPEPRTTHVSGSSATSTGSAVSSMR